MERKSVRSLIVRPNLIAAAFDGEPHRRFVALLSVALVTSAAAGMALSTKGAAPLVLLSAYSTYVGSLVMWQRLWRTAPVPPHKVVGLNVFYAASITIAVFAIRAGITDRGALTAFVGVATLSSAATIALAPEMAVTAPAQRWGLSMCAAIFMATCISVGISTLLFS